MIITLIYPHDDIFAAVKQESSLHSIRQTDKDGKPMFETLVFDEAYLVKFRELFFNAQAQITPTLSAYIKHMDREAYFERKDFSKDRDFILHLEMPEEFNRHMKAPIEDYVFNFLKDWIMYRWLETKMPDTAATFLASCMAYEERLNSALNSRSKPIRRYHGLY